MPRYDCLCAGIVVADHLCAPVEHVPAAGELVTTDRLDLTVGGCASNVAVDMARLGTSVAVVGVVGRDVFGEFVRRTLHEAGVDVAHLGESATSQTSGTLVLNVRGEDRRFVHAIGANAEFDGTALTAKLIGSARVLYLGGYCLSALPTAERIADIFRTAREAGVTTVLDLVIPRPADYWPRLKPVLPWTDVFLPNSDESRTVTGQADPVRQADEFHAAGARTVVITCGGDGAVLISDRERLRAAKYDVEFVDGTGSGDAFTAGYIYGLLQNRSAVECLTYGSALGASCVRRTGATTGVFTAAELADFVAQNELPIEPLGR